MIMAVLTFGGTATAQGTVSTTPDDSPFVIVLGIAQDGGAPHAGCTKPCCAERWLDPAQRRHVSCLGLVDPAASAAWLIDATPDFPVQAHRLGDVTLAGILLTHAHIGHYTGLMYLGREAMGARALPVYAMPRMRAFLETNGPWDQLAELNNIDLRPLAAGEAVELNPRVSVTPLLVPHRDEYSETVGFRIDGPGRSALYISDIDKWHLWDRRIEDVIADVDVAWLDGTFYDAGEVPGRAMEEIPHPFIAESMQRFASLPARERAKIRFIHLNHTNPALDPDTEARRAIEAAGFRVADEGERFDLAAPPPAAAAPGPTTRPTTRPARQFDVAGSDAKAIDVADRTMEAMGGREAWEQTRYITWNFFGRRRHVWDKHANRLRLERPGPRSGKPYVMIIDLAAGTGRVWRDGEEVTAPVERASIIDAGIAEWINDSYWLVMPYKLKDPGVKLRYKGRGETEEGHAADVLILTFDNVGRTPSNMYYVWVGDASGLVEQWSFFANTFNHEPAFTCPWRGWKRYGRIMLSGDRGVVRGRPLRLTDIAVFDELPESVFSGPEPVNWSALMPDGAPE
jgi:pyrroloquinoline quinone biosynthesis protein B